jgi:hypothetical protein
MADGEEMNKRTPMSVYYRVFMCQFAGKGVKKERNMGDPGTMDQGNEGIIEEEDGGTPEPEFFETDHSGRNGISYEDLEFWTTGEAAPAGPQEDSHPYSPEGSGAPVSDLGAKKGKRPRGLPAIFVAALAIGLVAAAWYYVDKRGSVPASDPEPVANLSQPAAPVPEVMPKEAPVASNKEKRPVKEATRPTGTPSSASRIAPKPEHQTAEQRIAKKEPQRRTANRTNPGETRRTEVAGFAPRPEQQTAEQQLIAKELQRRAANRVRPEQNRRSEVAGLAAKPVQRTSEQDLIAKELQRRAANRVSPEQSRRAEAAGRRP